MKHLKIIAVLALTGLMLSCGSQEQESTQDHSGEIDSLLTELRMMDDSLNSINIREIQHINDSLEQFYDTAQVRDSQAREFRLYEESRNILKWYGNVNREINYSRSHLRAMKKEFKSEDLPGNTKKERLKKEKQIVASIKERFDEEFESLKKEVRALLKLQKGNE
jgi:hypothetical protein